MCKKGPQLKTRYGDPGEGLAERSRDDLRKGELSKATDEMRHTQIDRIIYHDLSLRDTGQ